MESPGRAATSAAGTQRDGRADAARASAGAAFRSEGSGAAAAAATSCLQVRHAAPSPGGLKQRAEHKGEHEVRPGGLQPRLLCALLRALPYAARRRAENVTSRSLYIA